MQVKRILKSKQKERIYYEVILQNEIFSLRWLSFVGAAMMAIFIVIDYWRAEHFGNVLLLRGFCVAVLLAFAISTYDKNVNVRKFQWACYALSTILFASSFFIDFYG